MTTVNPFCLHLLDNLIEVKFQYIMCTLTQFTGSLQFVSHNFVFSFHINAPVSWVPTAGHAAGTVVSSAVIPLSRPLTAKHVVYTDDRAISSAPLVLLKTYLFSLYPAAGVTVVADVLVTPDTGHFNPCPSPSTVPHQEHGVGWA